jgi:hypothetical protein
VPGEHDIPSGHEIPCAHGKLFEHVWGCASFCNRRAVFDGESDLAWPSAADELENCGLNVFWSGKNRSNIRKKLFSCYA